MRSTPTERHGALSWCAELWRCAPVPVRSRLQYADELGLPRFAHAVERFNGKFKLALSQASSTSTGLPTRQARASSEASVVLVRPRRNERQGRGIEL